MNLPKTYLTEAIDAQSIFKILAQHKQINRDDPEYDYYKKLAVWASSDRNQLKIKNVNLNNIKLSDKRLIDEKKLNSQYNSLGSLLDALKNLMDQKGKKDPELSKLIQQTTLEILGGLSGIKDPNPDPEPAPEPEPETDLKAGLDWTAERAKRLKAANNELPASKILDNFYNDYYSIEYAGVKTPEEDSRGIVSKLNSLNKVLIPEFTKLGYNPEVNPLAQFLKILIMLKDKGYKIFDKLNTNNYGAIHNAFIESKITGNILGNYNTNKNHILFCEDLYNYKGLEIVKYLGYYKNILSAAEKKAESLAQQDKWTLAAKIAIHQDIGTDTATDKDTTNTFTANVDSLLKKQDNIKTPTDSTAKLRTLLEIEELYNYIFGESLETEESKENEAIKAVLQNVKNKKAILDMIYYIISREDYKQAYSKDAKTAAEQLTELKYTPNSKLIEISKQILALYEEDIKVDELRVLVKKLFTTYSASKKKGS
jgi:hypothetical protein